MPRDVSRGLQALERLARDHGLRGVHGPLIDLFDCAPQLAVAVDVAAGGSAKAGRMADLLMLWCRGDGDTVVLLR